MQKKKSDQKIVGEGIAYLINNVHHEIHFLLSGPRQYLRSLLKDYDTLIHIAATGPTMDALFHQKRIPGGKKISAGDHPQEVLLKENLETYKAELLSR